MAEETEIQSDKVNKKRYHEAEKWTIVGGLELKVNSVKTTTRVLFGLENKFRAIIQHAPFAVDFQIEGETHVQLNSRGLLNLEHWRPRKHTHEAKTEEDESTWWEESFDGHTDSKPRGPESVGMDVSFPGYNHVFGIPEHADALLLKETRYVLFENLDKYQIPYDAIWLDIEYTDGRKYFTWDPLSFTNPEGMQEALMEPERKLVVLIDPHIKKAEDSYFVSRELRTQGLAVLDKKGEIYDADCWPGLSNWIDTFNPATHHWWSSLHQYDRFQGSLPNLYIENDMNEPSVFDGPEATMPRDNLHFDNWEHRDIHNANGLTMVNATFQAMLDRENNRRPFILTRSFYSGSQRMTAMWTGDN
ncbi:hypothetical protein PCG10_005412 [Penicillium crustosum]|uniref:alpha-glucosidase n=2 Tax=Penicillium crustosum TaxID=36656 RepID=A0A9P5GMV0_PENCR|nr:hypothetical protein PCG10_005412 [Penicillium crustosum]